MRNRISKSFRPLIGFTALILSCALVACSSSTDANLRNPDGSPYNPKPTPPDQAIKQKAHSETLAALALSQLNWSKQAVWLSLGVDPYSFTRCMSKSESKDGLKITRVFSTRGNSCKAKKATLNGALTVVTDYRQTNIDGDPTLWPTRIELTKSSPFLTAEAKYSDKYSGHLDVIDLRVTLTETDSGAYSVQQVMRLRSHRDSANTNVRGSLEVTVSGLLNSADFFQDSFVFSVPVLKVNTQLISNGQVQKSYSSSIEINEASNRGDFPLQKGLPQGTLAIVQSYQDGNKSKDFDGTIEIQGQSVLSTINKRARSLPGFAVQPNIAEQFYLIETLIREIEKTHFGAPTSRTETEEAAVEI